MKVNYQKYRISSFTSFALSNLNYGVIQIVLLLCLGACSFSSNYLGEEDGKNNDNQIHSQLNGSRQQSQTQTNKLKPEHSSANMAQSQFMSSREVSRLSRLFLDLKFNKSGWGDSVVSALIPVELEGQPLVIVNFSVGPSLICNLDSKCASLGEEEDHLANFTWHNQGLLSFSLQQSYLIVFDLEKNQLLNASRRLPDKVSTISFTDNGLAVFAGTISGRIYNWYYFPTKLNIFGQLTRYAGHPGLVSQIISHPTNRIFFSLDWLGQLSAWQTFESREYEYEVRDNPFDPVFWSDVAVSEKKQFKTEIEQIYLNSSGRDLLILTKDSELLIWKVRGFEALCKFKEKGVKRIAINQEWTSLVVNTDSGNSLYDLSKIDSLGNNTSSEYCSLSSRHKSFNKTLPNIKKYFFLGESLYTIKSGRFLKTKF